MTTLSRRFTTSQPLTQTLGYESQVGPGPGVSDGGVDVRLLQRPSNGWKGLVYQGLARRKDALDIDPLPAHDQPKQWPTILTFRN